MHRGVEYEAMFESEFIMIKRRKKYHMEKMKKSKPWERKGEERKSRTHERNEVKSNKEQRQSEEETKTKGKQRKKRRRKRNDMK